MIDEGEEVNDGERVEVNDDGEPECKPKNKRARTSEEVDKAYEETFRFLSEKEKSNEDEEFHQKLMASKTFDEHVEYIYLEHYSTIGKETITNKKVLEEVGKFFSSKSNDEKEENSPNSPTTCETKDYKKVDDLDRLLPKNGKVVRHRPNNGIKEESSPNSPTKQTTSETKDYKTVDDLDRLLPKNGKVVRHRPKNGPVQLNSNNGIVKGMGYRMDKIIYLNNNEIIQASSRFTMFHSFFIRDIISHQNSFIQVLPEEEILRIFKKAVEDSDNDTRNGFLDMDLKGQKKELYRTIDEEINPVCTQFNLKLKRVLDEVRNNTYYYVITEIHQDFLPDGVSKIREDRCIGFTEYLSYIMERIISEPNHVITFDDALNLRHEFDETIYMTKSDAKKSLNQMAADDDLVKSDNYLYIGPKGIANYSHLLENIEKCIVCDEPSIMGNTCKQCKSIYHALCYQKYIEEGGAEECIKCQNALPLEEYGVLFKEEPCEDPYEDTSSDEEEEAVPSDQVANNEEESTGPGGQVASNEEEEEPTGLGDQEEPGGQAVHDSLYEVAENVMEEESDSEITEQAYSNGCRTP